MDVIHAIAIRDTLLSIPEVTSIVGGWNGQTRIFWLDVPEDVPMPYITTQAITGGSDSMHVKSEATDMVWEICGHTANPAVAVALAEAIGKIHRHDVVDTNVQAVGYDHITWVSPVSRRYQVQNNRFYEVGGLYRIRLSLA